MNELSPLHSSWQQQFILFLYTLYSIIIFYLFKLSILNLNSQHDILLLILQNQTLIKKINININNIHCIQNKSVQGSVNSEDQH